MDACRELYPEEKALVRFLRAEGLTVYDVDLPYPESTHQEYDRELQERLGKLFTEMERVGVRAKLDEANRKLGEQRNVLRTFCLRIPINELLTSDIECIREIGKEFAENIKCFSSDCSTMQEAYDEYDRKFT